MRRSTSFEWFRRGHRFWVAARFCACVLTVVLIVGCACNASALQILITEDGGKSWVVVESGQYSEAQLRALEAQIGTLRLGPLGTHALATLKNAIEKQAWRTEPIPVEATPVESTASTSQPVLPQAKGAPQKAAKRKRDDQAQQDPKPFKCKHPGCPYAAAESRYLKSHQRYKHRGEKPYKCTYPGCEYASAKSSDLNRHQRTHTGEKPFKCPYLGCTFATAQSPKLKQHERCIHTGEKPFKCPHDGCPYAAATSSNLNDHKRSKHPAQVSGQVTMDKDDAKSDQSSPADSGDHTVDEFGKGRGEDPGEMVENQGAMVVEPQHEINTDCPDNKLEPQSSEVHVVTDAATLADCDLLIRTVAALRGFKPEEPTVPAHQNRSLTSQSL